MTDPPPEELEEAESWRRQAHEELLIAQRLAAQPDLPDRAACFHAHLAAEKALKALNIRRGVIVRRIHDLRLLARALPDADARRFEPGDLELLNPWTIDGRYPADLEEVGQQRAHEVHAAAERVMAAVDRAFDGR